ncbi:hypothetical protein [Vibrio variabilis]|uniref:hypothetical protein n=1 Tax=Vibrio variabilis TaxID=990271 RepID=UPI000DD63533|nr:hypothetical protein [Vibrio variabilis]
MKNKFKTLFIVIIPILFGCEDEHLDEQACPSVVSSTLEVLIIDADTEESLKCDSTLTVKGPGGDVTKDFTKDQCDPEMIEVFGSQAGFYDIYVSADEYETLSLQGIEVVDGRCGVETQRIKATLKKL